MPTVGPWKCAAPEYTRVPNEIAGAAPTLCYKFKITHAPHDVVIESAPVHTIDALRRTLIGTTLRSSDYNTYLIDLFTNFLKDHGNLFVKKYTAEKYASSLYHEFIGFPSDLEEGDHTFILNPVELVIKNGKFVFYWLIEIGGGIDVQLEEEESKSVAVAESEPLVLEVDDIDAPLDSNEIISVRSGLSDKQVRDRQRVEEARLRAKLATVRAERALERYIQKYGDYETEASSADDETDIDTDIE